jgi:hypothetical protein
MCGEGHHAQQDVILFTTNIMLCLSTIFPGGGLYIKIDGTGLPESSFFPPKTITPNKLKDVAI